MLSVISHGVGTIGNACSETVLFVGNGVVAATGKGDAVDPSLLFEARYSHVMPCLTQLAHCGFCSSHFVWSQLIDALFPMMDRLKAAP
jgi:hypothetical protein